MITKCGFPKLCDSRHTLCSEYHCTGKVPYVPSEVFEEEDSGLEVDRRERVEESDECLFPGLWV